ncbi:alpha/beta hydrolase [Aureimonas sp. SA4125]|uniref:alpha/beta fold hydrolase n=1 Tax=Aureimonas sp. SA4125 TaxID=2826993 RepID=UPI001CC4B4F7|nr:alpha/beta hydrolase [Aureimonas sp. SA4125]BDA83743.1 alpha/beta hydrolase [Aureimonas sp. SA4125]
MKQIDAGVLNVAFFDTGPADGPPVILLHGFPYDAHAYDTVAERLATEGKRCIVPFLRGYGETRFLDAGTPRSGQQAALGADLLALMDALAIEKAVVAGYDWGGRAATIVAALWPERVKGLVSCGTGYNIQDIAASGEPADPAAEHRFWYQYYFHAERGRLGLTQNRDALCRLIWNLWSPTWAFTDETFARSAKAFRNPDFVDVVVHSYRHRFGLVPGDPAYDAIEQRLAAQPHISVPAIVLKGADDGVDPPGDGEGSHFTAGYEEKIVRGVGHNFPQEAPGVFADAVLALG